MTAMTDAACRTLRTLAPTTEPERFDRLAERLERMADLLVEVRRGRLAIAEHRDGDDLRVREDIAHVAALGRSLGDLGGEAASFHQLLQHVHLV